jgi:anti-sigma factor RsiW
MPHPSDTELLKWTAGRADAAEAEAIRVHLDVCEACRRKAAALGRVHSALGRWAPEPPAADLWPTVRKRLAGETRPPRALPRRPALLRWAAAVILAGLLGHLAARAVRHGMEPAEGPRADAPTVAAYLHLHAVTERHPPGVSRSLDVFIEEVTP